MKIDRESGFSLLELLIAGTILSLGLLALLGSATSAHQIRRESEEKQLVHEALEREIEVIQATRFADLIALHDRRSFDVLGPSGAANMLSPLPGDPDGRVGSIEVRSIDPPGDPAVLLQVLLQVEGRGVSGVRRLRRELRISAAAGGR